MNNLASISVVNCYPPFNAFLCFAGFLGSSMYAYSQNLDFGII